MASASAAHRPATNLQEGKASFIFHLRSSAPFTAIPSFWGPILCPSAVRSPWTKGDTQILSRQSLCPKLPPTTMCCDGLWSLSEPTPHLPSLPTGHRNPPLIMPSPPHPGQVSPSPKGPGLAPATNSMASANQHGCRGGGSPS